MFCIYCGNGVGPKKNGYKLFSCTPFIMNVQCESIESKWKKKKGFVSHANKFCDGKTKVTHLFQ